MNPAVSLNALTESTVFRSTVNQKEMKRLFRGESAVEAVGELKPRQHLFGVTKGQFSIIDLWKAVLRQTGPAAMNVSTWTAAAADLGVAQELMASGKITDLRFLVDFTFQRRQPAYAASMRELFGRECIRVTKNHAKFCTIRNAAWSIVIRTSMNLNFNARLEDFTVEDDPALADFLDSIFNQFFETRPATDVDVEKAQWHKQQFTKLN